MSREPRNRNGAKHAKGQKPSNVSGWVATIAALVLIAIALAFPLRGQIVSLWNAATSGKSVSTPATETASDQGISATIESTCAGEETSTVTVCFKDDDGLGRVSDQMDFGHYSVQVGKSHPFSTSSLVSFDAASGEARYAFAIDGNLSGKRVVFDFFSFISGTYSFMASVPYAEVAAAAEGVANAGAFGPLQGELNGFGAKDANGFAWNTALTTSSNIGDDEHRPQGDVLFPNAFQVDVPGAQGAYISNVAYDGGVLYLQAAIPLGAGECMLGVHAESSLTGESFPRSGDSFAYLYDADATRLQIYETQCAVSADDLANCTLGVNGFGNRGTTEGSWRVACSFPEGEQETAAGDSASE